MTKYLFVLLLATMSAIAFGQLTPQGLYEQEVSDSRETFFVIPASTKGIILTRKKYDEQQKKPLWEIIHLDVNLDTKWTINIESDFNSDLIGYETNEQYIFLLFSDKKQSAQSFQLTQLAFSDQSIRRYNIRHDSNLELTHFSVEGESILFGGYINSRPTVLLYELGSTQLKVVPGLFQKEAQILDFKINDNHTFSVLLLQQNPIQGKSLVIRVYSQHGVLLIEKSVEVMNNINILTGLSSGLKRNDLMVLGTYTLGNTKRAHGIYTVPIKPLSNQSIRYYPFSSFEHFFDHLGEKRASRLKSKSENQNTLGKKSAYSMYLQPVKVEENKTGFFLLAEVYNMLSNGNRKDYQNYHYYDPRYGYYTPIPYGRNPYMDQYPIPLSAENNDIQRTVRYIQSVLVLFSEQGNPLWDTSFSIDNVDQSISIPSSDFIVKESAVFLVYKKESNLFVKKTDFTSTSSIDTVQISLKNELDKVLNEYSENSGIRYWYTHHFYAWGYRNVRNRENSGSNRHVFYINKFEVK